MPAEVESMFYAGETPWHGLGVGVEKAKTSAAAIKLAGLDWTVALGPVWAGSPDRKNAQPVEGRYAIYRESDGFVYATNASDRYQPWQNSEAFDFLDSLLQDGTLHYETAGSLRNGARIWALARLEQGMRVADDDYFQYMLLTSGHDLYGSIQLLPTNVRVVCQNTLTAAISGAKAGSRVKISHIKGSMDTKLAQAREAFKVTTEANRRMAEWLEKAATTKLTEANEKALVEGIFGPLDDDDVHATKRLAATNFRKILAAEQERGGKTAYSAINTITGFADHTLRYNGDDATRAESRMLSVIEGSAEKFKENGIQVLRAVAPKAGVPLLA